MNKLKRVMEINEEAAESVKEVTEITEKTADAIKGGKSCSCSCSCPANDTDGGKSATTLNTFAS